MTIVSHGKCIPDRADIDGAGSSLGGFGKISGKKAKSE
jgi:hypothetical protein